MSSFNELQPVFAKDSVNCERIVQAICDLITETQLEELKKKLLGILFGPQQFILDHAGIDQPLNMFKRSAVSMKS